MKDLVGPCFDVFLCFQSIVVLCVQQKISSPFLMPDLSEPDETLDQVALNKLTHTVDG